MKKLVIVESPAKAKTIKNFLGRDYEVVATKGHIRDLPAYAFGMDISDGKVTPKYVISKDHKDIVTQIKKIADKSDKVYIATDEDREGEAIGYHLIQTLNNTDVTNYPRIVFHEITKSAIQEAIKNPRQVDLDKVNAQQTRRLLDRIVGYRLSPLLSSKIQRGLSAGRVQSAALKIAVDRERERQAFKPQEYYKIDIMFNKDIPADLKSFKQTNDSKAQKIDKLTINNKNFAKEVVDTIKKDIFNITTITKKNKTIATPAPFITSTLQQHASSKLGFSPTKTMSIAQRLYEGISVNGTMQGIITYMRTDSVTIAKEAIQHVREYIKEQFGTQYLPKSPKMYKNKATTAQEAHEAIRPVNIDLHPDSVAKGLSKDELKLYTLIYNRFLASQMENAKFDLTAITVESEHIQAQINGRRLVFDGFYKITPDITKDVILPDLNEGDSMELQNTAFTQKFTEPPNRYSEASLIKELEQKGIGRPSTYAPTIGTLQKREYIKIENKAIVPEAIAFEVITVLEQYFTDIVDSEFTAKLEDTLDDIVSKGIDWQSMLNDFYIQFMEKIDYGKTHIKSQKMADPIGEKCPDCNEELVKRKGRYGEFISCSSYPKCKYSKSLEENSDESNEQDMPCDKCNIGKMVVKHSRRGAFYGCSNYPKCKNIKPLKEPNKLEVKCPKCSNGDLLERFSKRGKFYGCSNYPDCTFISKYPLIAKDCTNCDSTLAYRKELKSKISIVCYNEECKHTDNTPKESI